jgi:ubiquinone/menaquinone biosynthesis C-methylase UbiE
MTGSAPKQSQESVDRNVEFFRDQQEGYNRHIQSLDTYAAIRARVNESLSGVGRLLDIGNGGVFDYDVTLAASVTALDLFLDQLDHAAVPAHVRFVTGSALSLPIPDGAFDAVVINMLLHHLVGRTVEASIENVQRALSEALRVLRPGGRLVLIESCVPSWFYRLERVAFRPASRMIGFVTSHPVTLQFPAETVAGYLSAVAGRVDVTRIPKGRWVLQYGVKVPAVLTPVCPYRFVAQKAE